MPLLTVKDLRTWLGSGEQPVRAVDGIGFTIEPGETFVVLGESGCGKSMTALSIMRLLPAAGRVVDGEIWLQDRDLLKLPETAMRRVRGGQIGMIFQEPQTSLNPVMTVGQQIGETLALHKGLRGEAQRRQVLELLDAVGIPDRARRYGEYPHQLSGGMKQRVMIAMALAGEPELLIADEPTTALDVTIQAQVLDLLRQIQRERKLAILLITHDLGVVAEMADRVAVMYAGQIVEENARAPFFASPRHPYTQKLFAAMPKVSKRGQPLTVIPGSVPALNQDFLGCRFASRCEYAWASCSEVSPGWTAYDIRQGVRCHLYDGSHRRNAPLTGNELSPTVATEDVVAQDSQALLTVRELKVYFPIHTGVLQRVTGHVRAVDDVSLTIHSGMTLALVGESGCGKTTAGKGILRLIEPSGGEIFFDGSDFTRLRGRELRARRADIQFIFQDPYSSMNPRMQVGAIIEEGMLAQGIGDNAAGRQQRIDALLDQVGLRPEHKYRYPHEFSGGQRQRISIARALAVDPKLIVCDEPTSALDVSVQAQILNLLKDLQCRLGIAYLFITHNLAVVEYLAHEVAVMYLGRIVEQGSVAEVLQHSKHPYTQALLSAVPVVEPANKRERIKLAGDLPSPAHPPAGCHFHPRCRHAMPVCQQQYPQSTSISQSHWTRCYLYHN